MPRSASSRPTSYERRSNSGSAPGVDPQKTATQRISLLTSTTRYDHTRRHPTTLAGIELELVHRHHSNSLRCHRNTRASVSTMSHQLAASRGLPQTAPGLAMQAPAASQSYDSPGTGRTARVAAPS